MKNKPEPKRCGQYRGFPCYIIECDNLKATIRQNGEVKKVLTSKITNIKDSYRVVASHVKS